MKDFELNAYYKQGCDLSYFLRLFPKASDALKEWANNLTHVAYMIRLVSDKIASTDIELIADTNVISLNPKTEEDVEVLKQLEGDNELISVIDYEEEVND